MTRIFWIGVAVLGGMWLLARADLLPQPISNVIEAGVRLICSLACPLFILSVFVAPGIYRDTTDSISQFWRRIATNRSELLELQRQITYLDRAHHMRQLGALYMRQGRFAKAIDWFQQSLAKDPDSLEASYKLALCLFAQKRYTEALPTLRRVHQEKPGHDYGMAYLRLAQTCHRVELYDEAAEVYAILLKFYPGHPEGSYDYAMLLAHQGETEQAAGLLRQMLTSLRLSPAFQRRRNRHWMLKAHCWLFRHGGRS